ncbi:MAG: DUF1178 family protein [Rhodobacteraceae bacterium]|nr:DUF1178 family protein [Paracoccaceae bacterium]
MINYSLKCGNGHDFQSWFANAEGYEALRKSGHVACPTCGDPDVEKALMAPRVRAGRDKATAPVEKTDLSKPDTKIEAELGKLKEKVEAESEYVGTSFATEARAMHDGDTPHRSIWGEAKFADAKALHDDGVPVMPLPFVPTRKTN